MRLAGRPPTFVLGVLRADTLGDEERPAASLEAGRRASGDRASCSSDDIYGLVPVEPARSRTVPRSDGATATFDLVSATRRTSRRRTTSRSSRAPRDPRLGRELRGKTDYLYYFLLLAVEKLAAGRRLCVIMPAGWMNAGNADFLRERLASELTG